MTKEIKCKGTKGMYYTPKELLQGHEITTGTGGFLKHAFDWLMSLFANPPYRGV